jgi:hypothetical protein
MTAAGARPGCRSSSASDLRGVDVENADDEHLFLAVHDREVAEIVERADVAGAQPAPLVDGRGGLMPPLSPVY